jgi:hypothetical protein
MHALHGVAQVGTGRGGEGVRGGLRGLGRLGAVAQAVGHQQCDVLAMHGGGPGVAADRLVRRGQADGADLQRGAPRLLSHRWLRLTTPVRRTRATLTVPLGHRGMNVEVVRQPAHRAQAGARRAARRVAVAHRQRDVRDAGAFVDGDQLHLVRHASSASTTGSGRTAISSRPFFAWRCRLVPSSVTTSASRPASISLQPCPPRPARRAGAPRRRGWRRPSERPCASSP